MYIYFFYIYILYIFSHPFKYIYLSFFYLQFVCLVKFYIILKPYIYIYIYIYIFTNLISTSIHGTRKKKKKKKPPETRDKSISNRCLGGKRKTLKVKKKEKANPF